MGQGTGSDWNWINATANRFERAWKDGLRPRIEDYLQAPRISSAVASGRALAGRMGAAQTRGRFSVTG